MEQKQIDDKLTLILNEIYMKHPEQDISFINQSLGMAFMLGLHQGLNLNNDE